MPSKLQVHALATISQVRDTSSLQSNNNWSRVPSRQLRTNDWLRGANRSALQGSLTCPESLSLRLVPLSAVEFAGVGSRTHGLGPVLSNERITCNRAMQSRSRHISCRADEGAAVMLTRNSTPLPRPSMWTGMGIQGEPRPHCPRLSIF